MRGRCDSNPLSQLVQVAKFSATALNMSLRATTITSLETTRPTRLGHAGYGLMSAHTGVEFWELMLHRQFPALPLVFTSLHGSNVELVCALLKTHESRSKKELNPDLIVASGLGFDLPRHNN